MVSVAARCRLHDARVRCSSPVSLVLSRQCMGLHPALWKLDHISSITCRYLPGFYTGTELYCLPVLGLQRHMGVNNLPTVVT